MSDTSFAFISEVKDVAQDAISVCEREILHSFDAAVNVDGNIEGYNLDNLDFDLPPIPDEALFNFVNNAVYQGASYNPHNSHVWSTTQMDGLQTTIFAALANGGIGISQALQDSIFNQDRERKLQALNDALTRVSAGMGAKGFRLPNSMLAGQRNELLQKHEFDLENLNREITKLMEEHARQNWQFCVEKGIGTEQFHAEFANKYDGMFVELTRLALERYKTDVEVGIQAFKSKIEGIIARLNAYKARIDATAVGWNSMLDKAKTELAIEAADKTAWLSAKAHEVSNRNGVINAYAHLVGGYAAMASGSSIDVRTGKL